MSYRSNTICLKAQVPLFPWSLQAPKSTSGPATPMPNLKLELGSHVQVNPHSHVQVNRNLNLSEALPALQGVRARCRYPCRVVYLSQLRHTSDSKLQVNVSVPWGDSVCLWQSYGLQRTLASTASLLEDGRQIRFIRPVISLTADRCARKAAMQIFLDADSLACCLQGSFFLKLSGWMRASNS